MLKCLHPNIHVLNRLLERPIDSTKNRVNGNEAHLLDSSSSRWAAPIYSTNRRENGTGGPFTRLLSNKWDRPVYSIDN